jgi:TRAP transporter TAXI family solute receptor
MKRLQAASAAFIVLVGLLGCGAPKQTFVNIASGGTGGTYYPLAGAMAGIWQDSIKGLNASAQTTGASVANVNLLREAKADIVFLQNDIAYYALKGIEVFKDAPFAGIRGMASLYPESCQIIVLAESGISSVADLRGKRVAVGAAGSGAEANARQILDAASLSYADILPQYLSFNEASSNLKDGNIDAAFVTAGYPTAAVQDIAATKSIKLVQIDDGIIGKLIALYPFYTRTIIPASTYRGVDHTIQTVSVQAMLAVSSRLEATTVEKMLQSLFANSDRLTAAHRAGAMISLETAQDGMSIPLHEGAEKFYGKTK